MAASLFTDPACPGGTPSGRQYHVALLHAVDEAVRRCDELVRLGFIDVRVIERRRLEDGDDAPGDSVASCRQVPDLDLETCVGVVVSGDGACGDPQRSLTQLAER